MKTLYERADVVPLLAEIFRELGYEGATLTRITARTGIGKGSLYHFFPGGKEEMAAAVLEEVDGWFEREVHAPLREDDATAAITAMWRNTEAYFHSGGRVCLVGAFALDETRSRYAGAIAAYFVRWIDALAGALVRAGAGRVEAVMMAEEVVSGIQGALVLSRALDDKGVFKRLVDNARRRVEASVSQAAASRA